MDKRTSYAEFSSSLNDKNIVIIELGRKYTKCGFAGESAPRAIIESLSGSKDGSIHLHDITSEEGLLTRLGDFIEKLYFNHLAVTPKLKKVVIVESVFCRSLFRRTLTRILFERFDVPAILFVPDHLVALATLGLSTGLVVDIGAVEATSIAVVDGVTLLDGAQFANLGAKTLDSLISHELAKSNPHLKEIGPRLVEDIRVKSCFVAPFERGRKMTQNKLSRSKEIQTEALRIAEEQNLEISIGTLENCYFLSEEDEHSPATISYSLDGYRVVKVPGNLREGVCEVFFELIGHEHSLTTLIVETILAAPIDCRRSLASNILIIGGTANMPGLEQRLHDELSNLDVHERFRRKVPDEFLFHEPICSRNYVSWLGASIFCTPSAFELRATTRDQWLRDGRKSICDWSDMNR